VRSSGPAALVRWLFLVFAMMLGGLLLVCGCAALGQLVMGGA
jgi:hypothetical protein